MLTTILGGNDMNAVLLASGRRTEASNDYDSHFKNFLC